MFSVNEGSKYPITGRDRDAINCDSVYCAVFGTSSHCDLLIYSESNYSAKSACFANQPCFNLPHAIGNACE
jgi:hypothetical protein